LQGEENNSETLPYSPLNFHNGVSHPFDIVEFKYSLWLYSVWDQTSNKAYPPS